VVPLATPEVIGQAAVAAQLAQLVYNNGPLIAQAQVFTIFWGAAWQQAALTGLVEQVNGFFDYILTSALIDQLAEYSVAQYRITHGARIGTVTLASPAVPKPSTILEFSKTLNSRFQPAPFRRPMPT
jgi:hypothetical protein